MTSGEYNPSEPSLQSWVDIPAGSDFPIQNLPFGIFSTAGGSRRAGAAIGGHVLDLARTAELGYFDDLPFPAREIFRGESLNGFLALGRPLWRAVRERISRLLNRESPQLREHRESVLVLQQSATMHVPVEIGDYVDFYSSLEHATNVGRMFRPDNPLLPNWRHLPVGYHGRSSSIVVSGTPIRRPRGQINPDRTTPVFAPSRKLDFELEVGFLIGQASALGSPVPADQADSHIFGLVLVNDWSARDIQQWEYVPLGPFLGKSFATSVSPWIVTLDALEPFRVDGPPQDPAPLPYLQTAPGRNLDVRLEVLLQAPGENPMPVCRTNFRYMYWNMEQQLAHLTSNGANLRVGDLCASGTVSGPSPDSFGSLLELTWNGDRPIRLPGGAERTFLADGDTVVLRGSAGRNGVRIGFGEVRGEITPAEALP